MFVLLFLLLLLLLLKVSWHVVGRLLHRLLATGRLLHRLAADQRALTVDHRRLLAQHLASALDHRRWVRERWLVDLTVAGQVRHAVRGERLLLLLVTVVDDRVLVDRLIVFVRIAGLGQAGGRRLSFGAGDQATAVSRGDLSSQFGFLNEPMVWVVVYRLLAGQLLAECGRCGRCRTADQVELRLRLPADQLRGRVGLRRLGALVVDRVRGRR